MEDCSRFDKFEEEEPFYPGDDHGQGAVGSAVKKTRKRKDINFPGYTYKKDVEDQKTKLVQALKGLLDHEDGDEDGNQSPPEQEQRIPKQQERHTGPMTSHQQSVQASAQQSSIKNQQVIEQKNKQIVIKNTNIQNQGLKQPPSQRNQANQMIQ